MADVTPRAFDVTKVFQGEIADFSVSDGTDKKLTIQDLGVDLFLDLTETVNKSEIQLEDYSKKTRTLSRDLVAKVTISEVDTTDIGTINTAANDTLVIVTEQGGTNGTGVTITVADADDHEAHVEGNKTVVVFTKRTSGNTLGYSIVANAA